MLVISSVIRFIRTQEFIRFIKTGQPITKQNTYILPTHNIHTTNIQKLKRGENQKMEESKPINFCVPAELIEKMDKHLEGRYGNRTAFLIEAVKNQIEKDLDRENKIKTEEKKEE